MKQKKRPQPKSYEVDQKLKLTPRNEEDGDDSYEEENNEENY